MKEKYQRDIQSVRSHLPRKNEEGRTPGRLQLQDAMIQVMMMMPEENQEEEKMLQKRDTDINLNASRQTIKSTGRDNTQTTMTTSTTIENVESVTTAIRNSNFHSCHWLRTYIMNTLNNQELNQLN